MTARLVRLFFFSSIVMSLSGCAALLLGAGAAGGYAISQDSIKNTFELSSSHVYRTSREVIGKLGLVSAEDELHGIIRATVEGATVTITVRRVTEKSVELKVKARNGIFPKVGIAQSVYNQIASRL